MKVMRTKELNTIKLGEMPGVCRSLKFRKTVKCHLKV